MGDCDRECAVGIGLALVLGQVDPPSPPVLAASDHALIFSRSLLAIDCSACRRAFDHYAKSFFASPEIRHL